MQERIVSVALDDIHKRFDANEVLKGISVSAHQGEVISVLGPSGSGKSTLLRCINLLEIPDSGRLFVSGAEVLMKKTRDNRTVPADTKQVERI
ncbi:MAG: ATP-binding cassette domain-containing protein, partial [Desulfofustis sp.]|nr:ATP-binding cassette domain-containing protein [Desulfofustis sp.]